MRFLILFLFSAAVHASPQLTVGAGIDGRAKTEVNGNNNNLRGHGELYMSFSKHPWSVLWEISRGQKESGIGNYRVTNIEYTSLLWGRFEPWYEKVKLSPYFGLGLGYDVNDVTSSFGSAYDSRWADGGFIAGLAVGVMTNLWEHWNLEAEVRYLKIEMTQDPVWSFVYRTGYTF